ncbi:hypothetical protein Poly51_37180 [Rubripirellula tenax]|uniref:Uncharacterized protein n=1 Tax=Rubripirellula tenax TaxID=2528015 RepID=A0A5C6F549_9BACT|nr:hypothetical protein Poly51_37180 [Rubripirellula tenax]
MLADSLHTIPTLGSHTVSVSYTNLDPVTPKPIGVDLYRGVAICSVWINACSMSTSSISANANFKSLQNSDLWLC